MFRSPLMISLFTFNCLICVVFVLLFSNLLIACRLSLVLLALVNLFLKYSLVVLINLSYVSQNICDDTFLGGSGGILPWKIFEICVSKTAFPAF